MNDKVKTLIEKLKDEDWHVQKKAAEELGKMKDKRATAPLIDALKGSENPYVLRSICWALGKIGDKSAILYLVKLLNHKEAFVRKSALYALGEIGGEEVHEPIESMLKDKEVDIRALAARLLGKLKSKESINALISALNDENPEVRKFAAWSLGEIKDKKGVIPLINALKDKDSLVRESAIHSLGKIKDERARGPIIHMLLDNDKKVRERAKTTLENVMQEWYNTEDARKQLHDFMKALKDTNSEVRRNAAWALGEIGYKGAITSLIKSLRDKDPKVREEAAYALGKIKDNSATEKLICALSDKDPEVRGYAAWALGRIKDKRAIGPLIDALLDNNAFVSYKVKEALNHIDPYWNRRKEVINKVSEFVEALKSKEKVKREIAAWVLGKISDPETLDLRVDALISVLEDPDNEVRETASISLGEIGDAKAIEPIIHSLKNRGNLGGVGAIKKILHIQEPLLKNYPNLFCKKCHIRAEKKVIKDKIFNGYSYVLCPSCKSSLHLIISVGKAI